ARFGGRHLEAAAELGHPLLRVQRGGESGWLAGEDEPFPQLVAALGHDHARDVVGRDQDGAADALTQLTEELDSLVAAPGEDLRLRVVARRRGRRAQRVVAPEDPDAEPPERPRDPEP